LRLCEQAQLLRATVELPQFGPSSTVGLINLVFALNTKADFSMVAPFEGSS
jgi:hypothetical protein